MHLIPDSNSSAPTREELIARLELMEAMVAEGRWATGRCGWMFVLWGLVNIAGVIWQSATPRMFWPWPTVLMIGIVLQIVGLRFFCRTGSKTVKNRSLMAVWRMMGVTLMLYCLTGMFTHHARGIAYIAAIFMIVGMAHGVSALILRWPAQGLVSALWLAGGLACYLVSGQWLQYLFVGEMCVGMVLFGFYAMLFEGSRSGGSGVGVHG